MQKRALITGITGQDGSYLAEYLLGKGYEVHGIRRRTSLSNTGRLDHVLEGIDTEHTPLHLHYGDLADGTTLTRILQDVQPDEIYNLGALSHVAVSFEMPEYTANVNALGTLRLLEAIRTLGLTNKTRFYQAASSEIFGGSRKTVQNETTSFHPLSPYAASKLYAYWITVNYRESYGMYACNGIMFNHESPRRGEDFVTRKITKGLASIAHGLKSCLYMGNLDAARDWGHARDYVKMQWQMLQQDTPEDYVIATGNQMSVRDFIILCGKHIGLEIEFDGNGVDEIGVTASVRGTSAPAVRTGDIIIRITPRLYRPLDVLSLQGDAERARRKLGWTPTISVEKMCRDMLEHDLEWSKRKIELDLHRPTPNGVGSNQL